MSPAKVIFATALLGALSLVSASPNTPNTFLDARAAFTPFSPALSLVKRQDVAASDCLATCGTFLQGMGTCMSSLDSTADEAIKCLCGNLPPATQLAECGKCINSPQFGGASQFDINDLPATCDAFKECSSQCNLPKCKLTDVACQCSSDSISKSDSCYKCMSGKVKTGSLVDGLKERDDTCKAQGGTGGAASGASGGSTSSKSSSASPSGASSGAPASASAGSAAAAAGSSPNGAGLVAPAQALAALGAVAAAALLA